MWFLTARKKPRKSPNEREGRHRLMLFGLIEESAEREGLSHDGETVDRRKTGDIDEESDEGKKDKEEEEESGEVKYVEGCEEGRASVGRKSPK